MLRNTRQGSTKINDQMEVFTFMSEASSSIGTENMNTSNFTSLPSKIQPHLSLSPLRKRKKECIIKTPSRKVERKPVQISQCENHEGRCAQYSVQSGNEILYYCKNCAVRLASQGFPIMKLNIQEENIRFQQINTFVNHLQSTLHYLEQKAQRTQQILFNSEEKLSFQINKLNTYYEQIYNFIQQHHERVIEELKMEYQKKRKPLEEYEQNIQKAIQDGYSMKNDVVESVKEVVLEVKEEQFRPIMDIYTQNVENFKQLLKSQEGMDLKVREFKLRDSAQISQSIIDQMKLQWDGIDSS